MDVTLLLNQPAESAHGNEASRESTPSCALGGPSTAPSTALPTPSPDRSFPQRQREARQGRGRTPWSAGGYSLPLHADKSKLRSASTYSLGSASDDASSYPTTPRPGTHSRADLSDSDLAPAQDPGSVSRPLPFRAATSDSINRLVDPLERRTPSWDGQTSIPTRHKFSDSHSSHSSYASWHSRSHSRISSVTTISGGYGGGPLPIPESKEAEDDQARLSLAHGGNELPRLANTATLHPPGLVMEPRRPESPPDDVLNMRAMARAQQTADGPRPPLSHLYSSAKLHKRAISAPDFAHRVPRQPYGLLPPPRQAMAISAGARRVSAAARDGRELASLRELEPDPWDRPARTLIKASPDVASLPADDDETKVHEDEPRCMFVANCDTGSQLRKAISHLFGRNKSCTLKIPKEVWVYYCRKHYQRIRYRNARTYPSNQMDLVKVQIRRLQAWSESNKARGQAPYIKQWTLSLRKREQTRLEGGKAPADDGDEDQAGSAVPDWIIQLVGDGYMTDRMLAVAERLHKEIADGLLSQVPEIEFLPDIVDADGGGAATRPDRARRQNSSNGGSRTPKRKAGDLTPMKLHASPELLGGADEAVFLSKRARLDLYRSASPAELGLARSMAPLSGDGRWGSSVPLRGPKVVPQMRPFEHGDVHLSGAGSGLGLGLYADRRPRLPSMSAGHAAGPPPLRRPVPGGHGAPRSAHQRSISAFTPASRPVSASARPSSSGACAQVDTSCDESPLAGPRRYHDEPGWGPNYTQARGPQPGGFPQPATHGHGRSQSTLSPRSRHLPYGLTRASTRL